MSLFITGGTSSIGRVLVKSWAAQGQTLRVLVRQNSDRSDLVLPGVEFVFGDVTDAGSVYAGMEGCEAVVHMAAIVGHDVPEEQWWRVNRDGSRNVLAAAAELGVQRMVQVSSLSVLGHTAPGEMADETRPIDTSRYVNLYQKTKHAADDIAREYAARGLGVVIVYPGFGFGCSRASSHPSLQDQTLLRMASGQPVAIMGSGKNRLCLAYYRDTVNGIKQALLCGKTGEGYILGNENLTFPEIWQGVASVLGKQVPRRRVPLAVLRLASRLNKTFTGKVIFPPDFFEMVGLNWCFSIEKARRELGVQPYSFLEAITETWAEYQSQGVAVKA
jgi:dihydroflavonol-4-reductase